MAQRKVSLAGAPDANSAEAALKSRAPDSSGSFSHFLAFLLLAWNANTIAEQLLANSNIVQIYKVSGSLGVLESVILSKCQSLNLRKNTQKCDFLYFFVFCFLLSLRRCRTSTMKSVQMRVFS